MRWAGDVTTQQNTRRSPRNLTKRRKTSSAAVSKRKLDYENESDESEANSEDSDEQEEVDIFGAETLKMDWTEHPQYKQLYSRGLSFVADIGFKSPKAKQSTKTTLKTLAQKAKVNLPDLRNEAEEKIVHAMTINKIKIIDTKAADMYADITKTES